MPYKITSDKTDLGKRGDVISDELVAGLNVEALIAGDHLEVVKNSTKQTEEK